MLHSKWTAKLFQSNTRSNNSKYDAGCFNPKVFANCRVQGPCTPCTPQLRKTFGSKRPASYFELLLRVLLVNDFAVHNYILLIMHQRMNRNKLFEWACKMCNRTWYELRTFWSQRKLVSTSKVDKDPSTLDREHGIFLEKDKSINSILHVISVTQHMIMCTQHIRINAAGHYKDTKAHMLHIFLYAAFASQWARKS